MKTNFSFVQHHIKQFPHCDPKVLHAPGECEHCDAHPEWQALRQTWGIAFTGAQPAQGEFADPATHARGLEIVDRWPGNRKQPPEAIPVDLSARVLTDGSPVTDDHREINSDTGMQKAYVVLSPEERGKGFVRPVRHTYTHKTCGAVTSMGLALAETYARCPTFYSGTYCVKCRAHFPLNEFVWQGTNEQVGS